MHRVLHTCMARMRRPTPSAVIATLARKSRFRKEAQLIGWTIICDGCAPVASVSRSRDSNGADKNIPTTAAVAIMSGCLASSLSLLALTVGLCLLCLLTMTRSRPALDMTITWRIHFFRSTFSEKEHR